MSFDPNAIRQDYELLWGRIFDPAEWVAATDYDQHAFVQNSGVVYFACDAVAAADDFNADDWEEIGPAYPLLYQNTVREIPPNGAVRVVASWGKSSSRQAIPCSDAGSASFVEGVMSIFIYTPKNQGSAVALQASNVVRRFMNAWGMLPDPTSNPRPCYMLLRPNGPRSGGTEVETSFFTMTTTCELQAWDQPVALCS